MKLKIVSITLIALGFTLVGCQPGTPAAGKDASDIAGRAAAWVTHYNSGDLEAVAELYTEGGCRMLPNAGMVCGRDEILAALEQGRDQGVAKVEIEVSDAGSSGDLAWGQGTFEILGPDGASADRGKWMNVSKRSDGKWLIDRDIFNSDLPVPGSEGTTLIGVHEVANGAKWLEAWDGEDSRRGLFAAHGAPHVRTFQSEQNPNLTGLVIQVTDIDAFTTWLESSEGQAAAAEDGVKQETVRILGEVE